MILADSRMDCVWLLCAYYNIIVVRIAPLEYSKIHEKAYKCIVCEFGGFQNVLRDACVSLHVHRLSDIGIMSAVDPVITFLVALLRPNYETTGVSSKKNWWNKYKNHFMK